MHCITFQDDGIVVCETNHDTQGLEQSDTTEDDSSSEDDVSSSNTYVYYYANRLQ